MQLETNKPVNLIRLAKFFAKTTDKILELNLQRQHQDKIPIELLDIRDVVATKLPE